MITVVGCWEDIWMDPERSERRIWKQTIQAYDVEKWIMWPDKGKTFTSPLQYQNFSEIISDVKNTKKIFLMPEFTIKKYNIDGINLRDLKHPKDNVSYIFGRTEDDLIDHFDFNNDLAVYIDTDKPTDMFGHVALGITLYDRKNKNGH